MVAYADSSFLISLLTEDSHSTTVKRYMARNPDAIFITSFSKSETQNAIRVLVFKKQITLEEMARSLLQFTQDESEGFFRFVALESDAIFLKASQLSNRHAVEFGVRYLDTLHVASALLIDATHFLTFDARQGKLAKAVGLQVKP